MKNAAAGEGTKSEKLRVLQEESDVEDEMILCYGSTQQEAGKKTEEKARFYYM